ncbi:MAG: hypothetical protein KF797_05740 [Flavobacteriales bacterium]|nr:hypothetical protein [Flavobacteriales bacterium]
MSNDKPFRKINELVEALSAASRELGTGTLQLNGLETACGDARELYERLVVLRHKAREAATGHAATPPPTAAAPNKMREAAPEQEQAPLRLDTRPAPEPASRQTSLIEAIEHTEQEKMPAKAPAPSLAEKMEKAAVSDLNKAISLSQKFWFVAELFNGDRTAYDKAIEQLNTGKDVTGAMAFVQNEVVAKLKKPADPEAVSSFTDLVQRRHT